MRGQRKIWSSLFILLLMTILLWFDKITGDHYVNVLQVLMGSFALANGAEHIGKGIGNDRTET